MRTEFVVCPNHIEEKLQVKYSVTAHEAEQVLASKHRIRFLEKGSTKSKSYIRRSDRLFLEDIWPYFLSIKPESKTVIIISARSMSKRERKSYGRK